MSLASKQTPQTHPDSSSGQGDPVHPVLSTSKCPLYARDAVHIGEHRRRKLVTPRNGQCGLCTSAGHTIMVVLAHSAAY
jgi:hypothetical protein